MKLPSFFFSQGDCGCSTSSRQYDRPVCPPTGARVTDDRYFSLALASRGQALVVPKGSNSQTFLTGDFSGFVFFGDGEVSVKKDVQLTLTLLNPSVSGNYPVPGGFKYITGATGDPAEWRHIAAPSTGRWIMQSVNGQWVLTDAGSIPGIQDIGNSGLTVTQGSVMMLVNSGTDEAPIWVVRRLAVADKRVIVGQIDGDTGEATFHTLPVGTYLEHPKAKLTEFLCRTFATLDADGNAISGGIEQAVVTGAGSISDPTKMVYSPATKRIYQAPPGTLAVTNVPDNGTSTTITTSYVALPSGHGAGISKQYNYPTVRVDFFGTMNSGTASSVIVFGVFRDGTLLQEIVNDDQRKIAFCFVDQACPYGIHSYEIRWKKTSGTPVVIISNSYLTVQTIA